MAFLPNKTSAQPYASNFLSYLDVAQKPQYYMDLIKRYGDGLYMFDFVNMFGKTINIGNNTMKLIEEGAPERPVTCSIAITAAPLNAVSITFSSADGSDKYVRAGFDLVIPSTYTNANQPINLRLTEASAGVWTGTAYDATHAITSVITTKEFILAASSWVRGSGQPKPNATGLYERDFNSRIIKDTAGIEGGQLANMDWEPVRKDSGLITSRNMTELEFRYNSQVDSAILLGEDNSNANNTDTSQITSVTSQIKTTQGILPAMEDQAQKLPWTTAFGATQYDAVKPLLEGQGVSSRNINFFVGTDLMTQTENDLLEWLKTNSAINPLYDGLSKAGFGVQNFKKNGYVFDIIKLDSFSNPNKFGAAEYPFKDYGFMFTGQKSSVTDRYGSMGAQGGKAKLNNFTLGYVNNNGENRKRILQHNFGVNGMGFSANNDVDGGYYYLLTEFMNILVNMNQTVLVTK
jgi:hypothetical protein